MDNGNVGNTDAGKKYDNQQFTTDTAGTVEFSAAGTDTCIQVNDSGQLGFDSLFVYRNDTIKSIGVGISPPIYNGFQFRSTQNVAFVFEKTDTSDVIQSQGYLNAITSVVNCGSLNDVPFRLMQDATWRVRLENDDSVYFSNGAYLDENGQLFEPSDMKMKTPLMATSREEALDMAMALTPQKFTWAHGGTTVHGYYASEVKLVSPGFVKTIGEGSEEHDVICYNGLISVLNAAIQKLKEKIDALETRCDILESQLSA